MIGRLVFPLAAGALAFLAGTLAAAADDDAFGYKATYRNVAKDPDGIWTRTALSPGSRGVVTILEYQLKRGQDEWLVSQIWNDDCSSATCPTGLVEIGPGRRPKILVDDMMRQVVPPDDPRFAQLIASKAQVEFARHPFVLSDDGKTLINGDYKFAICGTAQ